MSTSGTPTVSCVGDLDELEILTATSATLATPPPMDKLQSRVTIVIDRKRARTLSQSTPKNVGVGIKKPKLEQKKSVNPPCFAFFPPSLHFFP